MLTGKSTEIMFKRSFFCTLHIKIIVLLNAFNLIPADALGLGRLVSSRGTRCTPSGPVKGSAGASFFAV